MSEQIPMDIPEDKDPTKLPADATNEEKAKRYYNAGAVLGAAVEQYQQAKFSDGSVWEERDLYLESIKLDANFDMPYGNLATCLESGETITLGDVDGHEWSEQALYIRAIQLNQETARYWMNLAIAITPSDRVCLVDKENVPLGGIPWDQRMLLVRSLELEWKETEALFQLAKTYQYDAIEKLKFPDGKEFSDTDLYLEVLDLDSSYVEAYNELGKKMAGDSDKKVKLKNGKEMNAKELFIKAIELDPDCSPVPYAELSKLVEEGGTITLADGSKQTSDALIAKATELGDDNITGEDGGA